MNELIYLLERFSNALENIDNRLTIIETALQLLIEDSIENDLIFEEGEVS